VVKGAPVKMGGVGVGRVDKIALAPERRDAHGDPLPVRMELSISSEALGALHQDAQVTVATLGPLGEAYLEVYAGSANAPALDPSHPLRGVDPARLDLVAAKLSAFLGAASHAIEDDPEALTRLVKGVSGLSHTLDAALSENRGDVHALVAELAAAAADLRALTALARKNFEPGGRAADLVDDAAASARTMRRDLPGILAGLSNATSGLTAEDGQKIKAAIDRYAAAGEALDRLAQRGDKLLSQMEAGQGTLGGLYKDPGVYQDLKVLVTDLKKHPWKVLWKD